MTFRTSRPLRFGDCDPSGIAYFPAYCDLLVGVVEEFFAASGVAWPDLIGRRRIGTPTAHLDLDFVSPAVHGDRLDFAVEVTAIGRSSLTLTTTVTVDGRRAWTATQVLVATSLDTHRSLPWPDDVRTALAPASEMPLV